MSTSISRPARPACTAAETTCTSFAPAPATSDVSVTSILQKAGAESLSTIPAWPAAGTSTFDPPPITRTGIERSRQRATTRASASSSTGSQK